MSASALPECWLGALPREEVQALRGLLRQHAAEAHVELFLRVVRTRTGEVEPFDGSVRVSSGVSARAAVRVWKEGRVGIAHGALLSRAHLEALLARAVTSLQGPAAPPPLPQVEAAPRVGEGGWPVSLAEEGRALLAALRPLGLPIQALLLTEQDGWEHLLREEGPFLSARTAGREAFVRCETPRGALLEAVGPALPGARLEPSEVEARLRESAYAVASEGHAAPPGLPLVLRPTVAAPLVSALGVLLRADVGLAHPALARAVGRQVFPPVLTVRDVPPPSGPGWDGEGQPVAPLELVSRGRLQGFLHTSETAARAGLAPNGRTLRLAPSLLPSPGPRRLEVLPGTSALPADCLELTTRLENFGTSPRPGLVRMCVGGWLRREGRRLARVEPFELQLQVLPALRSLQGVGADAAYLLAADGCLTPSLILGPQQSAAT